MENTGKGKKIGFIAAIVVGVLALAGGISYYAYQQNILKMEEAVNVDTIYHGITVNNVDVGGLTKDGANVLLEQKIKTAVESDKLKINANEKSFEVSFAEFGVKYDIGEAVNEAYDIGRDGSLKERYEKVSALAQTPQNIEAEYSFDEQMAKQKIEAIKSEVDIAAEDSKMTRQNGTFVISDEKTGISLDVEATLQEVNQFLNQNQPGEVTAIISEVLPKVTKAENEKSTDLIGSFYTSFSSGAAGRNVNLKVGCDNINGWIVLPGEVFSMNKGLGPQTYENGYRNAAVIVNGKIEDGLAGGVCQITTTLYNAVIFAELEVVERKNHSLAVAYVPLGRDAAVAGDYTDLKFRNNTDYPVYIEAYVTENKLVTNLYGHEVHGPGREVVFEKVFLGTVQKPAEKITEDPLLPEGERVITYNGKTGSKVSTYKKVFQDGKQISREWFSDSNYKATADEVTVGTKKPEAVQPAAAVDNPTKPAEQIKETENPQTEANPPTIGSE